MHDDALRSEFTHQSAAFNQSPVMRAEETLGSLVALVAPDRGARWLETACGPGLISRALAQRVGEMHGVDLTPAMIDLARREAAAQGLGNLSFSVGDATALELAADSFDGAVTRFSLHHVPLPGRLVTELARVVRRGGEVVVADHVTDGDAEASGWHQEIERLRDPSHWACLTPARLRALGRQAGLTLEHEQVIPFALDFEEWLARGSGGPGADALIEQALAERPEGAESFRVVDVDGARRLELRYWLTRWRR